MKTMIRNLAALISLFTLFSCASNRNLADSRAAVLPISDSTELKDGSIVYGLPRTVFTIIVDMERTVEMPGPYAQYAEDLVGIKDVIRTRNESWNINGITLKTHDEIDPSEYYLISSSTLFRTNVLALKKEGLILDLNPSVFGQTEKQTKIYFNSENQTHYFDMGSDEYFQVQRDTAYKRISVDSSFVRIPYIDEKKKKLSDDQLAEKAAKRLLDVRDGKHMILSGETNVFPQSDAAINEINRMEKEYTELFAGKTTKEKYTLTYQIIPQKSMIGNPVTFFRFTNQTGPVSLTSGNGTPVTIEFVPEMKTRGITVVNRTASKSTSGKYDKLFYRVPDVVGVKIKAGTDKLFDSRKLIYQFGDVIQLPANYLIGK